MTSASSSTATVPHSKVAELLPAFTIGLAATLSPCALPLYPGFLAYLASGGERLGAPPVARWLGFFVLAGVLTTMLALGALIASLSLAVGQVLVFVTPVAYLVVIAFGVALLFGANPFAKLPQPAANVRGGPLLGAYVYGLLYGPIALPCAGPFLVSAFALSLSLGSFGGKMLFFLAFALGFGVPLLALSLLAPARRSFLLRAFTRHYAVVSRLAGALLVAVAGWSFTQDLPAILLYLGL